MTAIQKEADEIISLMRQSRMDRIREELESLMKTRDRSKDDEESAYADIKIGHIRDLFKNASNNAPLP